MEFHPDWLYTKEEDARKVEGQLLPEASPMPPCRDITPTPEVLLGRLHDRFYTLMSMKPSEKPARIKALKELLDVIDRTVESGHLRNVDVSFLRDQVKTFWEANIHWLKRERTQRRLIFLGWGTFAFIILMQLVPLGFRLYEQFVK